MGWLGNPLPTPCAASTGPALHFTRWCSTGTPGNHAFCANLYHCTATEIQVSSAPKEHLGKVSLARCSTTTTLPFLACQLQWPDFVIGGFVDTFQLHVHEVVAMDGVRLSLSLNRLASYTATPTTVHLPLTTSMSSTIR